MPKFKTLEHNGVIFTQPFKPNGRKLNNEPLTPLAEEMLYQFTGKLETVYVNNPTFIKNFYKCLKPELTETQQLLKFPDDYQQLFSELKQDIQEHKEHMESTKEERKQRSVELKEKYGFAYVDGVKQPLGNYIIEPPGIYVGRGNSPLMGLWKYRTEQKDIVLNYVGQNPPPGDWKIEHNRNVLYIAYYNIDVGHITQKRKEIRFGTKSNITAERDKLKFKKSKKLLNKWDEIQNTILSDVEKGIEEALIAWLIQYTSIRIGTERDNTESENVVGASTLKVKNIIILSDTSFKLKFIGKDSIEFCETYTDINYVVIASLKKLIADKSKNENLFGVNAKDVNRYLDSLLPGLTAKVFRTAWASKLILEEIKGLHKLTLEQLKAILIKVSKKLNHRKAITQGDKNTIEKLKTKIEELEQTAKTKKQRERLKELKKKLKFKKDSLGMNINTALTNYINPVLIFDICKRFEIDVSKIYNKGLLERFSWVLELFE